MRRIPLIALAAVVLLFGAACGNDDGAGTGSGSASGSGSGSGTADAECVPVGDLADADTTVDVTLQDFEIVLGSDSAPAGAVGFDTTNDGPSIHELVVVEGVAPDDLPIADGAVDEDELPDGAVIGEIEGYTAGQSCPGVFDLAAGDYTVFCNVDDHASRGMTAAFTVTG